MFRPSQRNLDLEKAIHEAFLELKLYRTDSEEYGVILNRVLELHKMRTAERSTSVHPDTLATIAAHLFGIMLILKHERFNVISTKALSFLPRLR